MFLREEQGNVLMGRTVAIGDWLSETGLMISDESLGTLVIGDQSRGMVLCDWEPW